MNILSVVYEIPPPSTLPILCLCFLFCICLERFDASFLPEVNHTNIRTLAIQNPR